MSAAVERVLSALTSRECHPKRNYGAGWQARCPCPDHEDHNPSLSINEGDEGRAVIYCHGGCSFGDVVGALGLKAQDLFPDNGKSRSSAQKRRGSAHGRRIVARYPYCSEEGELLFEVVRYDPKDFQQRCPDGQGGWLWKLGSTRRVLYRLPELIKSPPEATVYVVEGERDADRLAGEGLISACASGGAGKWLHTDSSCLKGRPVVVLADNDEPGRRHAQDVASNLYGRAASVRVLVLPGLAEGEDVSDWLEAGGDPEDLDQLAQATEGWELAETGARASSLSSSSSYIRTPLTYKTSVPQPPSVPFLDTAQFNTPEERAVFDSISNKSLKTSLVFDFAKRLWLDPQTRGVEIHDLRGAVGFFHTTASAQGVLDGDFIKCWLSFANCWATMRFREPSKIVERAVEAASVDDLPWQADAYPQGACKLLSVCRELQRIQGERAFFMSCRLGAEISGSSKSTVSRWLRCFLLDEILEMVTPGQVWLGGLASRYQYKPKSVWGGSAMSRKASSWETCDAAANSTQIHIHEREIAHGLP